MEYFNNFCRIKKFRYNLFTGSYKAKIIIIVENLVGTNLACTFKKFRIWETVTLSTDGDRSTDTTVEVTLNKSLPLCPFPHGILFYTMTIDQNLNLHLFKEKRPKSTLILYIYIYIYSYSIDDLL